MLFGSSFRDQRQHKKIREVKDNMNKQINKQDKQNEGASSIYSMYWKSVKYLDEAVKEKLQPSVGL